MELISSSEFWIIIGIVLLLIELIVGLAYLGVTFGVGSLVTGVIIYMAPSVLVGPINQLLVMACISAIAYFPIKYLLKKDDPSDINKY